MAPFVCLWPRIARHANAASSYFARVVVQMVFHKAWLVYYLVNLFYFLSNKIMWKNSNLTSARNLVVVFRIFWNATFSFRVQPYRSHSNAVRFSLTRATQQIKLPQLHFSIYFFHFIPSCVNKHDRSVGERKNWSHSGNPGKNRALIAC